MAIRVQEIEAVWSQFVSRAILMLGASTTTGWCVEVCVTLENPIWWFPKIGVPPVIIHLNGIFHCKPSILGVPHLWKPQFVKSWRTSNPMDQVAVYQTVYPDFGIANPHVYSFTLHWDVFSYSPGWIEVPGLWKLVGGLVAMNFIFPLILGFWLSSQLTKSYIFQRGGPTTNQLFTYKHHE